MIDNAEVILFPIYRTIMNRTLIVVFIVPPIGNILLPIPPLYMKEKAAK